MTQWEYRITVHELPFTKIEGEKNVIRQADALFTILFRQALEG